MNKICLCIIGSIFLFVSLFVSFFLFFLKKSSNEVWIATDQCSELGGYEYDAEMSESWNEVCPHGDKKLGNLNYQSKIAFCCLENKTDTDSRQKIAYPSNDMDELSGPVRRVTLKEGETKSFDNEKLKIIKLNDSRCPPRCGLFLAGSIGGDHFLFYRRKIDHNNSFSWSSRGTISTQCLFNNSCFRDPNKKNIREK